MNIALTQGKVTQIDDEFAFLDQYKWFAQKDIHTKNIQYYAIRKSARSNGIQSAILLHRVIMEIKLCRPLLKSEEIDHINHDGLKNTLDNLRIVIKSQNQMNSKKQNVYTSSQFKGVTWDKNTFKWQAQIKKDGKLRYLGRFVIETTAARAYDTAAKLYFGEYAQLNFPED